MAMPDSSTRIPTTSKYIARDNQVREVRGHRKLLGVKRIGLDSANTLMLRHYYAITSFIHKGGKNSTELFGRISALPGGHKIGDSL